MTETSHEKMGGRRQFQAQGPEGAKTRGNEELAEFQQLRGGKEKTSWRSVV